MAKRDHLKIQKGPEVMERGARTRENRTELRDKVDALEYPVQLRMYLPLPKEEAAN